MPTRADIAARRAAKQEQERRERESRERQRRADDYAIRSWSAHVLHGGTYRGIHVPPVVLRALREAADAYEAAGAPGFTLQGPPGAIVTVIPMEDDDGQHQAWLIRADGTLTIGTDPEFEDF